jgi:hypothetical protein
MIFPFDIHRQVEERKVIMPPEGSKANAALVKDLSLADRGFWRPLVQPGSLRKIIHTWFLDARYKKLPGP